MKYILFVISTILMHVGPVFSQTDVVHLPNLSSSVSIRRDHRGIPYINAASDADLYFAQGFVTASDRLWQMDLLRRVARGETAEIFGNVTLNEDRRWRRFNFAAVAERNLQYLPPELRSALESYATGVNAYISTLEPKTFPVEFRLLQFSPREWKPADTIIVGKILADALSTTWHHDLLRASLNSIEKEKLVDVLNQRTSYDVVLFGQEKFDSYRLISALPIQPSVDVEAMAQFDNEQRTSSLSRIGLFAEDLAASNNWVIAGKHTKSGKPILANDPHLRPTAPGIWYLTHLSTPGMRVAGVTFPGVPGIVIGHNEFIAWGATNVGPDVQDIYLETFDGKGNYKTETGWQPVVERIEKIKVRRNPLKPETDVVEMKIFETRRGPVIIDDGAKKYSLSWTALDPKNNDLDAFFDVNRAKDWAAFTNGLRTYGGAAQNFIFADVKGNIGWYAAGKIPIRRKGDGSVPYDGSTNDGDWIGYIPFSELPHLFNPPSGLIVTANQRTVGTYYKYPAFIRDAAPPWRARRIFDLLNGRKNIDFDTVRDVQHDAMNIPLKRFAGSVVSLRAASPSTLSLVSDWDGRMLPESSAALIVNEIRNCAAGKIADENKPIPAALIRERILQKAITAKQSIWLMKAYANFSSLLKACDAEVKRDLEKRYGTDTAAWTWGKISAARIPHPLGAVPFIGAQFATPNTPLAGSGQTPNVASFVSMRFIASPGLWDETRQVIPLGQSGDPRSPHFKDQFEAWRTGLPAIFPFSEAAVEKSTINRLELVPVIK